MAAKHRFYLPAEDCRNAELSLSPGDTHHAINVLRLREGDRFSVLDGEGTELLCRISNREGDRIRGRILARNPLPAPACRLTLVQGVTKGKSMDWIIQKATELGCGTVIPVLSERTVIRCDSSQAKDKQAKWEDIAIEAMKQCGQGWRPEILTPLPLSEVISCQLLPASQPSLLASLQPDARHPRKRLEPYLKNGDLPPEGIAVWIGPEGDFTPAEINTIRQNGALPITLGPLLLRSETAAVYALSILNYEFQTE